MTEIDQESIQKSNETIRQVTDSLLIMNGSAVMAAQVIDAFTHASQEQCMDLGWAEGVVELKEMGDGVQ